MRFFALSPNTVPRRWLAALLLAVVVPAAVLLVVQYRALRTLEQTLPVYRRELLYRFLDAVESEVFHIYRTAAYQVLNVPVEALHGQRNGIVPASGARALPAVAAAATYFSQQSFPGARRYFVVVATEENGRAGDEVFFYNPATRQMELAPATDEVRAIRVACAAYVIYLRAGTTAVPSTPLGIDRDANYPMMVKFLREPSGRPVGLAGFLLELDWFRHEAVPQGIRRQLPVFFPAEAARAVVVLRVDERRVLYESQPAQGVPPEVTARLEPYFTRFDLGITMRGLSATQWARRSLLLNALLSVAMMLALLGALGWGWRAATRELKLSQMKTDFVANISHEFRTPLSSILALAELMRLGRVKDADEVREFGHYIESQGHRVMGLINNILDFARLEAGQKEFQFEPTEVRDIVQAALASCAGRLLQSGHTVTVDVPAALPPLPLDAAALTLALTNLLDNALKYSDAGQEIVVQVVQQPNEVWLRVRDHGIGIARDEQARIFEKFYRVGTGLVHDVKGSGLGLALVKRIVAAHGGRVTVESAPGRGSTFTMHLPQGAPVAAGRVRVAAPAANPNASG